MGIEKFHVASPSYTFKCLSVETEWSTTCLAALLASSLSLMSYNPFRAKNLGPKDSSLGPLRANSNQVIICESIISSPQWAVSGQTKHVDVITDQHDVTNLKSTFVKISAQ